MKIICIGDVHASGFSEDPIVDGLPRRLSYIKKSLDYIVDYGRKNQITNYILLGDLIHDKTIIYNVAQSMLYDFFKGNDDCVFHMISGNHDLSSTGENQKSAIEVFDSLNNVHCVVKNSHTETFGDAKCLFVPFTNNFLDVIKNIDRDSYDPDVLFAHVGLNEAVLQSGLSRVDKLRVSDLNGFKLAILGHYHKPQKLQGNCTVYYAGSLIPKDWNDKNESKRFLVFDTESLSVESVDIDCGIPMYLEYVITSEMSESESKEIIDTAALKKSEGHTVRVINRGKQKVKTKDEFDLIILEQQSVDITNRGITVDQTKMQQCEKYLEIKDIPENERSDYIKVLQDFKLLEVINE